ncbi:hypothetical protein C8Q74DRAFT_1054487 [Fomes fomentarius]|nr:hypothetical protein C8Q74DRAFT_1054487 [Fomes fomentarius]
MIGDEEGRMDVCIASAGIMNTPTSCLDYSGTQFQQIIDVNLKGVLFAAQAAGRQMVRLDNGGSIVLIASLIGLNGTHDEPMARLVLNVPHSAHSSSSIASRTPQRKPASYRWLVVWHVS